MPSHVLSRDPDWLESLTGDSTTRCFIRLQSGDGVQVDIPATLLLATSPLVRNILSDSNHLHPVYSLPVISIPSVTGAGLETVREVLSTGVAWVINNDRRMEADQVIQILAIDSVLDCKPGRNERGMKYQICDSKVIKDEYFEEFADVKPIFGLDMKIEKDEKRDFDPQQVKVENYVENAEYHIVKKLEEINESMHDEVEKKSKKRRGPRKRKTKLPGQPMKPMSGYYHWFNEEGREMFKKDNPGAGVTYIARGAGEKWREMDLGTKKKYDEIYKELNDKYEVEYKKWFEGGGEEAIKQAKKDKKEAGWSGGSPKIKKSKESIGELSGRSGKGFQSKEFIEDSESGGCGGSVGWDQSDKDWIGGSQ